MDELFAPWRIEWVEREGPSDEDGCVFCTLPTADDDVDNLIVARSDHSFVLLNNYPYNPGHVMVIPRQHAPDFRGLSAVELLDHMRVVQTTLDVLEAAMDPDGFNIGLNLGIGAGGSIGDHLHTHIVPRWQGDTNFMAVIGETKVIVEALAATYDRLQDEFGDHERSVGTAETGAIRLDAPDVSSLSAE